MVLRVATECSGLEPLPYALDRIGMGGRYSMVWACERDSKCRSLIRACHGKAAAKHIHCDITERVAADVPDHDLYVAGFPCQPFSSMGLRQGTADAQNRGTIFEYVLACLAAKLPRAFLLENVRGLVTEHRRVFANMVSRLRGLKNRGYLVSWRVLNTEDHGIPQHRQRVYIVGIRRDAVVAAAPFTWPGPVKPKLLRAFLDQGTIRTTRSQCRRRLHNFVRESPPGLKRRLAAALRRAKRARVDTEDPSQPVLADVDASKPTLMRGRCPCITRARGSTGFLLLPQGRRLSIAERLRLQGLPTSILRHRVASGCNDRQLGAMVGNAMSLNVLERVLVRLLPACGLAPGISLTDRWQSTS